ncbi:MAG TPA: Ppx/GppA phosphatase family protein [Thermodesulfobacteriota bacterium]|nr:Ppx/GppA phosphatase family protein [Thermodesulfobacteriota bacterium]
MRCASIDIGTNTLRLLIGEVSPGNGLKTIAYKRTITRLGGGYTVEGGIPEEAFERTISAICDFKKILDKHGVAFERVYAVATSVVRRAVNGAAFVAEVRKRTGIEVSVISGSDEAAYSLTGVLSAVEPIKLDRLVMDIGGGSTEFILARGDRAIGLWSMDLGVVHLTETFVKSDPPAESEIARMEKEIKGVITALKERMKKDGVDAGKCSSEAGVELVGTAGTVTTLAAIEQDLKVYDKSLINNYVLRLGNIKRIYKDLLRLGLKERAEVLSLEKGREDLIIPGSAISVIVMESFGFDTMRVSDAGLLEGVLLGKMSSVNIVT